MSMPSPETTMYLLTTANPLTSARLVFAGPLLAAVAVLLMAFPRLQPVRLLYPMLGACAFIALPLPGFVYGFSLMGFTFRPLSASLGVTLPIAYAVMVVRLKLPWPTAVPAAVMLLAGLAEVLMVRAMVNGDFARSIGIGG